MLLRLLHRNSGVLHVARKRKSKGWKEGGKEQSAGILHAHPRDRSLMKSSRAPDFSVNLYRLIPQHFFSLRLLLAEALKSQSSVFALGLIVKASLCQS